MQKARRRRSKKQGGGGAVALLRFGGESDVAWDGSME
jgi:hypothetical protein